VHSDEFLKNRLEIQIRSTDLKDAHSELIPTFELYTRYYLTRTAETSGNRLSIGIYMTGFNPYQALLKMKATGILVDMARTAHFKKMADNMGRMAKLFYKIHLLKRKIRAGKQVLALRRNKVKYGKSRSEQGAIDPYSVRAWIQGLRAEKLAVSVQEKTLEASVAQLKAIMGYHPDYYLPLDTRHAEEQLLGGFNGRLLTFADIQESNFGLKMLAKREQLQSVRVVGAYLMLIPKPILTVESISNQVDRVSGFNLALGLDHTVWDGYKRVRDIKRQKMTARKLKIDRRLLSRGLYQRYRQLTAALDLVGQREAFAREQARMTELNEERSLETFKSGHLSYEQYMESRVQRVKARVSAMDSLSERVNSLIELATIGGGLNRYNARIRY